MGYVRPDGKESVTVSATTSRILHGEEDLSQWDDEEIQYGQKRDVKGNFTGMSKLVPRDLLYERNRRLTIEAMELMCAKAGAVVEYWAEVLLDEERSEPMRMRAAENIANRIWGLPKAAVDLNVRGPAPFEQLLAGLTLQFTGGTTAEVIDVDAAEVDAEVVWDEDDDWTFD